LRWFGNDWPLENHFYRPISTLIFEFDNWRAGDSAAAFAQTNALLVALAVPLIAWLVFELFQKVPEALASAFLFVMFVLGKTNVWISYLPWLACVFGVIALCLRTENWKQIVITTLAAIGAVVFLVPPVALYERAIGWIPGRTATVMAIPALTAMASYARFERLSAGRIPVPIPGPFDPPATRSATVHHIKPATGWLILSIVAVALALGAYEQAVMLPGCMIGVAVCLRLQRLNVRWWAHVFPWAVLGAYLFLRHQVLPSTTSTYQNQQLRFGPGVYTSVLEYLLPFASGYYRILIVLSEGWILWLTAVPYGVLLSILGELSALWESRRNGLFVVTGLLLAFISFLPMAWLQPFEHYHYWPACFRAILSTGILVAMGRAFLSAVSLQGIPAPPRSSPAPGSLRHP
jgi:hypothetical protein